MPASTARVEATSARSRITGRRSSPSAVPVPAAGRRPRSAAHHVAPGPWGGGSAAGVRGVDHIGLDPLGTQPGQHLVEPAQLLGGEGVPRLVRDGEVRHHALEPQLGGRHPLRELDGRRRVRRPPGSSRC